MTQALSGEKNIEAPSRAVRPSREAKQPTAASGAAQPSTGWPDVLSLFVHPSAVICVRHQQRTNINPLQDKDR